MASKADLISDVAEAASVSKSDAEGVLGAFFDQVVSTAQAGGETAWPGFGKFSTSQRSARVGRNPQTGAPVDIPASIAMKFSSAAALKAALNGK
jgi:DNA-binding protein HU-beta